MIYKRREVTGISMVFMAVDICGGIFSIISLAFKEKFNVFMSITYLVVIVSSTLPRVSAEPTQCYAPTGYGRGYRNRRSRIKHHREA